MADVEILIPLAFFASVVTAIGLIMYFRNQRTIAQAAGGGDYQRLAEEAVRGQRVLLAEIQTMNTTLKEIERLLKEV